MGGDSRARRRSRTARRIDPSSHHSSHRGLLVDVPSADVREANVDAVIVPAARPASWLREAAMLARRLKCAFVVFCSRAITADEVIALGMEAKVDTIGVDMDASAAAMPSLATSRLVSASSFDRGSDSSHKRNTALVLARMIGWERVLFLDDDIFGVDPADVRAAAGLLDRYDAVGLHNVGFPDNSVVCHFFREIGADQEQFIGAGGLMVPPMRTDSLFPDIYNQDWFFLIGEALPLRAAVTGSMKQKRFDPFADPHRARGEEFGDCLAEGMFWLLDEGASLDAAGAEHWREFLQRRAAFLEQLVRRARRLALRGPRGRRQLASLRVAQETCAKITPSLCAEFVDRWRHDLVVWRQFVAELPTGRSPGEALAELGLVSAISRLLGD